MSINQTRTATHVFRSGSGWPYRSSGGRPTVLPLITAVAAVGPEFAKHVARRVRINAARRKLAEMPDHILEDIGIRRSEINYRVEYGRAEDEVRKLALR